MFFFFKQKTAYDMRISDWSSDVCSSDLQGTARRAGEDRAGQARPSAGSPAATTAARPARRRLRERKAPPRPSEGLPDRDIDADPCLTRLAPDRRRDIEAHRPEIGVIARADPGAEAQILECRRRRAIDLPRIDETDDAQQIGRA